MQLSSLSWLVDTSLRASVVILLLLCLRPALRSWIGSRALAWLWLAVAVRLLFPLPVPAPWHFHSLLPVPGSANAAPFTFRVSVSASDTPATPNLATLPRHPSPAPTYSAANLLSVIWLVGVLFAAARLARGCWLTRRWATQTLPLDPHSDLQSTFLALPVALRRDVTLRLTDSLDVPTLVGIFRPQIWLPRTLPATLTPAELRHVLLHELGHARRRDLLSQWVCSLACCLHWFNPLVWLLARAARTDRELACDASVLSHCALEKETFASYGHTLLKVVAGMTRGTPRALPVVSMAAGKRHLDLRVREIRAFRPVAPWRGLTAFAATMALVATLTVRGAATDSDVDPVVSNPPTAPASPSPPLTPIVTDFPAPVVTTPHTPDPSAQPLQVEIESKFIEVAKSDALKLEKSLPLSSPVSGVFHQVFAPFAAEGLSTSPRIFRSALVLPNDFQLLVRLLNQTKGVDLLSAPRVTTKSGQKATVEIIREFIYPTAFQRDKSPSDKPVTTPTQFDKKNTGVTIEVTPTIEPDGKVIDLSLTWTITNFDGFVDAEGKPVPTDEEEMPVKMPGVTFPMFDTRSLSTVATLSSGATVVFSSDEEHHSVRKSLRFAMGEEKRKAPQPEDADRLLLVFVTATLVDPAGAGSPAPSSSIAPSPGPTATAASLPYGVPVPGKPDFVKSPYAPDAGYVDLRGFTRDQSVRDPYTGKMFLVP